MVDTPAVGLRGSTTQRVSGTHITPRRPPPTRPHQASFTNTSTMSLVSTPTPRPTGRGIGATVAKAADKADKAVMSHQLQINPTALEAELRSLGETNRVSEAPGRLLSDGRQGGEECIRKGRWLLSDGRQGGEECIRKGRVERRPPRGWSRGLHCCGTTSRACSPSVAPVTPVLQ